MIQFAFINRSFKSKAKIIDTFNIRMLMMHLFKKKKPKLKAFVLSGGANMGCAQVGMLQALFEHGIYPDLLIGTSLELGIYSKEIYTL